MLLVHHVLEIATVHLGIKFQTDFDEPFEELPFHGTGFYIRHRGEVYLCTNWHNVSGVHFETGRPLKIHQGVGAFPKLLIVREWLPKGDHTPTEYVLPLHDDDGNPLWREKKEKVWFEGKEVQLDVVLIPAPRHTEVIELIEVLDKPHYRYPRPTDQVIVLGYPIIREKPIWKTGHIAETVQPQVSYFLINGRTKKGMSGSGVFTTNTIVNQNGGSLPLLIGIYSGRINDNKDNTADTLNDLDIGIVWKVENLLDLLPPEDAFPPKEMPVQAKQPE